MSIHLGQFKAGPIRMPLAHPPPGGPATVEVIRAEEKGSDVNLATYLLLDAFQNDCDVSVVISNDSDLVEPIRAAGLARAQLLPTLTDTQGAIHKPVTWYRDLDER